ncbi:hypothetical protein, partial [aff. Roholtiella sp. LEGE 12411]|uniref:hypothetical protein n=1 Tax=aff. Roholtiella sp. LEGE 12411 TaxID=1828822 RepID=UPI001ABC1A91
CICDRWGMGHRVSGIVGFFPMPYTLATPFDYAQYKFPIPPYHQRRYRVPYAQKLHPFVGGVFQTYSLFHEKIGGSIFR